MRKQILGPMRLILPIALAALLAACTQAQPPAGYYDGAEGLTGQPLRAALHGIITTGHDPISYGAIWNAFYSTDAKPGNKVWDMYSDVPGGTSPYVYTLGSDQCGGYSEEGDCYNREHSFPQSWFNSGNPMRTDLFHIYPTDGFVNQKRGNLPYGEVGSADWSSDNGSKVGLSITPGYNGTVFEPIDAYKGDFARSYFYMMTRYYGAMSGWDSPMLSGGDLAPWAVTLLVAWSDLDPVSDKETARNNAVFALQHNRNPFIDRPEWVHAIWSPTTGIEAHDGRSIRVLPDANGLHVDLGDAGPGTVEIRDMAGRLVRETALPPGRSHLAFNGAHGIYLAAVRIPGAFVTKRFAW